jgi:hypothetical protein
MNGYAADLSTTLALTHEAHDKENVGLTSGAPDKRNTAPTHGVHDKEGQDLSSAPDVRKEK